MNGSDPANITHGSTVDNSSEIRRNFSLIQMLLCPVAFPLLRKQICFLGFWLFENTDFFEYAFFIYIYFFFENVYLNFKDWLFDTIFFFV